MLGYIHNEDISVWCLGIREKFIDENIKISLRNCGVTVRCIRSIADYVPLLLTEEKPLCLILNRNLVRTMEKNSSRKIPVLVLSPDKKRKAAAVSHEEVQQRPENEIQMQLERFFAVEFGVYLKDMQNVRCSRDCRNSEF